MRARALWTLVGGLALGAVGCSDGAEAGRGSAASAIEVDDLRADRGRARDADEKVNVYVRLRGPSAAELIPEGADPGSPAVIKQTRARVDELARLHAHFRELLEARGAHVISELSRLTNALHVIVPRSALPMVRRLPDVERIDPVPLYRPTLRKTLDVVGAPAVWGGTTPYHGEGIRIGVIDSGIDYFHADFGGSGVPSDYSSNDSTIIEPGSFPTARVIGGWDVAGDTYDPDAGEDVPTPDPDPLDCGGHGTMVSGVAAGGGVLSNGTSFAGPYDQSLDWNSFGVAPGVAPLSEIFAIKVFGCDGPTSLVGEAFEIAADPNQDGSFDDRLDVVNLSLGSDFGYHSHTDAEQMTNLVNLGVVVVAAAGNADQIYYAAGTPGGLPEPIAAAGLAGLPLNLRVNVPGSVAGDYMAQEGDFTAPLATTGEVTGDVVYAEPNLGCSAFTNAGAIAGNLALIDRGTCLFVDKFANALAAGAIGVIVANHEDELMVMGGDGTSPLPGVLIRSSDAQIIKGGLGSGLNATLSPAGFSGEEGLRMWSVSSRGPSAVGDILKPDVAAPGDAIETARRGSGTGTATVSGTSFATPFVAGGAAILLQAEPALTPTEVKAALMASSQPVLEDGSDAPVSWQGAGRLDLVSALEQHVSAAVDGAPGAVHVSFGAVVTDVPASDSRTVTVTNRGGSSVDYALSFAPGHLPPGVVYAVEPSSLTVAAGGTGSFTVSFDLDPESLGAPGPDPGTPATQYDEPRHYINEAWGRVLLTDSGSGTQSFSVPVHAVVRAAAARAAERPSGCAAGPFDTSEPLPITVSGASAHPLPVVSAFELGAIDEEDPLSATDPKVAQMDLRAVGVASNRAAVSDVRDVELQFGIAISGQWSTPASSDVAIEIDSDDEEGADTLTVVHALTLDGPYADVFVATTYHYEHCDNPLSLRSCNQDATLLHANLMSRDILDTQPFLNSVIILNVLARDVGLSDERTSFRYRAITYEQTEPWPSIYDQTEWVTYDFASPSVDPAVAAPTAGTPIYAGDVPVSVMVPPAQPEPASVLLLHHTNVAGERWETIDPVTFFETPVTITTDFPESADLGAALTHPVTLTNDGAYALRDVVLDGTLAGATITSATPSQGSCSVEPALSCDLGDMQSGEAVTVELELVAASDTPNATLDLAARSAGGCESTETVSFQLTTVWASAAEGGGCGCRVVDASLGRGRWAAALLLLVVGAGLRRSRGWADRGRRPRHRWCQ